MSERWVKVTDHWYYSGEYDLLQGGTGWRLLDAETGRRVATFPLRDEAMRWADQQHPRESQT